MSEFSLTDFVRESNRIEGILREPRQEEIFAHRDLLERKALTVEAICTFVFICQPGAKLRDKPGRNVMVGNHIPPLGAPEIRRKLDGLLEEINTGRLTPHAAHLRYETLHPFMDGNGRSGRAIWLWQMRGNAPLGFLHHFYYQTLQETNRSKP